MTSTTSKADYSGEEAGNKSSGTATLEEKNYHFNNLQGSILFSNETKDTSDNDEIQDEEKGMVIVLMINTALVVTI